MGDQYSGLMDQYSFFFWMHSLFVNDEHKMFGVSTMVLVDHDEGVVTGTQFCVRPGACCSRHVRGRYI